jgi:predicted metalloprotease with PDZ domain
MVSYYDKGRWAGLVLDLLLRSASGGRRGLPDLFARLWLRFGAKNRPIDAAVVRREAEAIANHSLAGFFRRYIDGIAELPVPMLLRRAGVKVEAKAPSDANDPVKAARLLPWSGLVFAANGDGDRATVKNVVPASPAWRAGITFGDEIIAVDGFRVTAATVSKRLADRAPGQSAELVFFRKDQLRTAAVRLARNPERKWSFAVDPDASSAAGKLRHRWLATSE